jgi:Ca-activated chloride channel family protein
MTGIDPEIDFAFIRPLWLLGLLALPGLGWAWRRIRGSSGWDDYIDPKKLAYLNVASPADRSSMRWIVAGCLALGLIALAGPSWRTIPLPVQQTRDAMVIAFDLSPSMLATDLTPDRLTRARLKIIDLLRLRQEGETALIAYADDAYRVSPLTDDTATIEALVPSLHPNVMPGSGSQVEAAVAMARRLLEGAAIEKGVVLIVTDGIERSAMRGLEDELGESLRLCILGVGTDDRVPIPMPGGGFARDESNQTILARLNRSDLESLASRNGGCYADLSSDDTDLEELLDRTRPDVRDELEESTRTFDVRHDEGYWLILLLLPIVAVAFRQNVFWTVVIGTPMLVVTPSASQALEWADLWQRSDQREVEVLEGGVEAYRRGDYAAAAERFSGESSLHHYNRGNALALEGRLEEAIESYDQTLEATPDHEDAKFNRDIVEKLLEEQRQEAEDGEQDQEGEEGGSGEESDSKDRGDSSSDESEPSQSSPDSPQDSDSKGERDDAQNDPNAGAEDSDAREADDQREQNAPEEPRQPDGDDQQPDATASAATNEPEQEPLSDQSEQWLRNIPDDPGGLMRRKFQYQAETRRQRREPPRSDRRY